MTMTMTYTIHPADTSVSALQSQGCWVVVLAGELVSFTGADCEELAREYAASHSGVLHPARPAIQGA